jgi:phosphatidylserine decarboxylase
MKHFLFIFFQSIVPQHALSRLVGYFASSSSYSVKNFFITKFAKKYNISLEEAKLKDYDDYATFNEFFTRELIKSARPISKAVNSIISPADGVVSEYGNLDGDKLIQAKGKTYTVGALLASKDEEHNFDKFMTIYLSPSDYHRVHMPIDGELTKAVYVPGKLFSVNETTARSVNELFARNERLVCHFDTKVGEVVVVLVGAMIVAGIEASWMGKISPLGSNVLNWDYKNKVSLKKGDELGRFYLGSTVIMLFPKGVDLEDGLKEDKILFGKKIGSHAEKKNEPKNTAKKASVSKATK